MSGARLRPLAERVLGKYDDSGGPAACWPWTASCRTSGYGQIGSGGKSGRTLAAHRVLWVLTNGEIPDGLFVCHRCDNPPCVNPAHLFLGTNTENVRDSVSKGRSARGVRNGPAKLTDEAVVRIRRLFSAGSKLRELAAAEGVGMTTISKAVRRETWRHVQGAA